MQRESLFWGNARETVTRYNQLSLKLQRTRHFSSLFGKISYSMLVPLLSFVSHSFMNFHITCKTYIKHSYSKESDEGRLFTYTVLLLVYK